MKQEATVVACVLMVLSAAGTARGVSCGTKGVALTVGLDASAGRRQAVRGAKLEITYPLSQVSVPGSAAIENVLDADGSHGSLLVANADRGAEERASRVTVVYTATSDIPVRREGLVRVRFACADGGDVRMDDFRCSVSDVVGEVGNTLDGVSCALLDLTPGAP